MTLIQFKSGKEITRKIGTNNIIMQSPCKCLGLWSYVLNRTIYTPKKGDNLKLLLRDLDKN